MTNEIKKQKDECVKLMTNVEYYPTFVEENFEVEKYTKLPVTKKTALGTAFEPLTASLQKVLKSGEATSGFYKVEIPKGMHLSEYKKKSGYLGTVLDGNNKLNSQAVLKPLEYNPTDVFMAATLAGIAKQLDDIQEIQQEILDFLIQKEKSELKGDLNFLTDILNNYKFNWNNDKYKNSNHIKVLDIKHAAERKIDFYKGQIESKLKKKQWVYSDQDVKKTLEKVKSDFNDYQLSLYLYSFSSFLEVMLLENFESEYLSSIVEKIENYSFNYRMLYTKCYEQIDSNAKTSVQANLLKGLSAVNKIAGNTISKVPVIKDSKIDETLIEAGDKIGEFNENRIKQTMEKFISNKSAYVRPFVDNINIVNRLYNQSMNLLFDKENIYFGSFEE